MTSNYEEKQARKLERYNQLAEKAVLESNRLDKINRSIGDCMNGTPILVGHHSEGRHRRELERMQSRARKACELRDKAKHYENKADNIVNSKAISSDDPEAIQKLNAEIAELEKQRHELKNNYVINKKAEWFEEGSEHYRKLELESVTRKIRDKKKRIEQLRALNKIPSEDKTLNGITLSIDKTDNRVKLFFPSIPSEETRSKLKSSGFHWSPTNQAWQRMISNYAIYEAEQILNEVKA